MGSRARDVIGATSGCSVHVRNVRLYSASVGGRLLRRAPATMASVPPLPPKAPPTTEPPRLPPSLPLPPPRSLPPPSKSTAAPPLTQLQQRPQKLMADAALGLSGEDLLCP